MRPAPPLPEPHLDPDAPWLESYRLHDGQWSLLKRFEAGEPIGAEPFEAVSFDLFR